MLFYHKMFQMWCFILFHAALCNEGDDFKLLPQLCNTQMAVDLPRRGVPTLHLCLLPRSLSLCLDYRDMRTSAKSDT